MRFQPDAAVETLTLLLPAAADRRVALDLVRYVVGDSAEMAPATTALMNRFDTALLPTKTVVQ
ncbi:MAG: hypothetical protein AAFU49_21555 [Pseudomonadota bacterium]